MRLGEIIDGFEQASTLEDLQARLQCAIEEFGFAGYSFVDAGRPHLDEPYYFGTTGEAWEGEYRSNAFLRVDPCVSLARRTNIPFPWNSITLPPRAGKRKPGAQLLMEAASDHGFQNGYVFPFHFVDPQGRIYSTVNGLFWKDQAAKMAFNLAGGRHHELNLLLLYWTQRFIDIFAIESRRLPAFADIPDIEQRTAILTDREREVLSWAGRGRTVTDTSDILKIGKETVQTHITNAIEKLGATNKTHAVAKALHLGLVDL